MIFFSKISRYFRFYMLHIFHIVNNQRFKCSTNV
nr:MAG TPA_asm: hypothetical protein [Caudoviricetes sp.]